MESLDNKIRLARYSEAKSIAAMSRDLIESGLGWSWREPRVRHAILDVNTNCAVLFHHNKLLGFSIASFSEHTAHLNLLAVAPDYRRMGLGKQLVRWQEKVAETAGIRVITLEVRASNQAAIRFYTHLGYRDTGIASRYYSGKEDAVRMAHHF